MSTVVSGSSAPPPPPPGGSGKPPNKPTDKPYIPPQKPRKGFPCKLCKRGGEDKRFDSKNHLLRHLCSAKIHGISRRQYDRVIAGDLWQSTGLMGGSLIDNKWRPDGEPWDGLPVTDGLDEDSTDEEEVGEEEEDDDDDAKEPRSSIPLPSGWQPRPSSSAYHPPQNDQTPSSSNNANRNLADLESPSPEPSPIFRRVLYPPTIPGQPPSSLENNPNIYESWVNDAEYIVEHTNSAEPSFTAVFDFGFVLVRRLPNGGQQAAAVRLIGDGVAPDRLRHLVVPEEEFRREWHP